MPAPALMDFPQAASTGGKNNQSKSDAVSSYRISGGPALRATIPNEYSAEPLYEVILLSSPGVTGAQVSTDLQAEAKGGNTIILRSGSTPHAQKTAHVALQELPKARISVLFEPHLRHASVRKIQTLMSEFRQAKGRPETSTIQEELKSTLADTYKQAVVSTETRTFATAISMLQDFLRPHWSNLPDQQLTGIDAKLTWLDSQRDLNPPVLTKFYTDLVGVLGSRLSLQAPTMDTDDDNDDFDQ